MGGNLRRAQLAHQIAGFVQQTAFGAVEHQLVGLQIDGRASGDVFAGQVEDFPGGRITQRRKQHDGALVQQPADALAVDPANFAGVLIIDPLNHADGPRGDEVAAGHAQPRALHRRGSHVHGQPRLEGDAHMPDGVDHTLQRGGFGDAQAAVNARFDAARRQPRLDLRTRAEHQHQPHAEAVQQYQVVNDVAEIGVFQPIARQHDHEGAFTVRVDVGRGVAKPGDVVVHVAEAFR